MIFFVFVLYTFIMLMLSALEYGNLSMLKYHTSEYMFFIFFLFVFFSIPVNVWCHFYVLILKHDRLI